MAEVRLRIETYLLFLLPTRFLLSCKLLLFLNPSIFCLDFPTRRNVIRCESGIVYGAGGQRERELTLDVLELIARIPQQQLSGPRQAPVIT